MNTDKVININAGEVCRSFPVVAAIRAGNPEVIRLLTRRGGGGRRMEGRAADGEQPAFTVSKMIQNDIYFFFVRLMLFPQSSCCCPH